MRAQELAHLPSAAAEFAHDLEIIPPKELRLDAIDEAAGNGDG